MNGHAQQVEMPRKLIIVLPIVKTDASGSQSNNSEPHDMTKAPEERINSNAEKFEKESLAGDSDRSASIHNGIRDNLNDDLDKEDKEDKEEERPVEKGNVPKEKLTYRTEK